MDTCALAPLPLSVAAAKRVSTAPNVTDITNNLVKLIIVSIDYFDRVLKPNSITLSGRRQLRSWSQTCSELQFGLSSSSLAAN